MLKEKLFEHLTKGISAKTLRELVQNTAPFLANEKSTPRTRYLDILAGTNEQPIS